jgi:hypothetical protein
MLDKKFVSRSNQTLSGGQNTGAAKNAEGTNGAFAWAGTSLIGSGMVRDAYGNAIGGLDPSDAAGRSSLKAYYRGVTPQPMRSYIEMVRPGLGAQAGSNASANLTNPAWNRGASIAGDLGRVSVGVSLAIDAATIATANNRVQAASEVAGATAGGIAGGWAGAEAGAAIGAFGGPVGAFAGAVIGGIAGSLAGGYGGGAGGLYLYNHTGW